MKKLVAVFLVAVLGPSLVLAWLAMRSLSDQEIVVHSQRAVLHQGATDALASDLSTFMDDVRVFFGRLVDDLVKEYGAEELTQGFDDIVPARWGQASIGCVVTDDGEIICPPWSSPDPEIQAFLAANGDFLTNRSRAEVYQARAPVGNVIIVEETETPIEPGPESLEMAGSMENSGDEATRKSQAKRNFEKAAESPAENEPLALSASKKGTTIQQKVAVSQDKLWSTYNSRRNSRQQLAGSPDEKQEEMATAERIEDETSIEAVMADSVRQESTVFQGAGPPPAGGPPQVELGSGQFPAAAPPPASSQVAEPASAAPTQQRAAPQTLPQQTRYAPTPKARNVQPFAQVDSEGQFTKLAQVANDVLSENPNAGNFSNLEVNWGDLNQIMGDDPEGAISRFLEDGLHVLLWKRHPAAPGKVFWTELDLGALREDLREIVREAAGAAKDPEVSLALLDNNSQVVAQTVAGFTTEWKRPFVASEVGEILPHWEVAAYLLDPDAVTRSANLAQLTLRILVPVLLVAIALGAVLIFAEIGREMRLARQKTDFVSNVSHELKTPLTSIRMFSDLLSTEAPVEKVKRTEYSGIISREAGRLTRLINNLLDFSRMERGERKYEFEPLNAVSLAGETVETYRHQIESDGFQLNFHHSNGGDIPIRGDRDSLSQVLLNLLSNAEKYGGKTETIDVEVTVANRSAGKMAEIRVLDRGPGVSRKNSSRIFDKFFRADDSLSSGIEGSGLGLTLARQIAREHGGDVVYRPRDGGGSCFAMTLPVKNGDHE